MVYKLSDPDLIWAFIFGVILGGLALAYLILILLIKLHFSRRRSHGKGSPNS